MLCILYSFNYLSTFLIRYYFSKTGRWNNIFESRHSFNEKQETKEGKNGVYWPSVTLFGEIIWTSEIPQCPGSNGAGRKTQPHWYASENLVPKPTVHKNYCFTLIERVYCWFCYSCYLISNQFRLNGCMIKSNTN